VCASASGLMEIEQIGDPGPQFTSFDLPQRATQQASRGRTLVNLATPTSSPSKPMPLHTPRTRPLMTNRKRDCSTGEPSDLLWNSTLIVAVLNTGVRGHFVIGSASCRPNIA
jgi:hypothetical protein